MKSKLLLLATISYTLLAISCSKKTDEILALLQEIKQQNSDLKAQVTSLQKTTDSLSAALKVANQNIAGMDRKIDSIRNQLTSMVTQINSLSAQLNQANVNIADLQKRIAELQAKCQELVDLLRLLTGTINLSDGLVAYYPFNGNAGDSSGNGYHGLVNGAILTSDRNGLLNNAYLFSQNSFILLPNGSNIQGNNSRSVSFWFKQLGNNFNTYTIYKGGTNGTGNDFTVWYRKNVGGTYQLYIRRFVDDVITDSIPITQEWTHYAVTYDGTVNSNLKFFINGKEHLGRSLKGSGVTFNTAATQPEFGRNIDQLGVQRYLDGILDDFRIYKRALSNYEITYLANN